MVRTEHVPVYYGVCDRPGCVAIFPARAEHYLARRDTIVHQREAHEVT